MSMKIYTRTGDEGETGLFGGGRVPKDHPRVAAYGDVDELNSASASPARPRRVEFFDALLESIQRDLFAIGGHLATPDPEKVAKALEKADAVGGTGGRVRAGHGRRRRGAAAAPRVRAPGGHAQGGGAAPGPHRLPPRGAERGRLAREAEVPQLFVVYLNRLSDLLFTLARLANHREGAGDVTW